MEDIDCVFQPVGLCGGIYISSAKAASHPHLLQKHGIRAILTVMEFQPCLYPNHLVHEHLVVKVKDIDQEDISQHFQLTFEFIEKWRKQTNVLVHCYAGVSRSATLVIAYLLQKYDYSLEQVLALVKRRRKKINPNPGFIQQLKAQALKKGNVPSDTQIRSILKSEKNATKPQKSRRIRSLLQHIRQKNLPRELCMENKLCTKFLKAEKINEAKEPQEKKLISSASYSIQKLQKFHLHERSPKKELHLQISSSTTLTQESRSSFKKLKRSLMF